MMRFVMCVSVGSRTKKNVEGERERERERNPKKKSVNGEIQFPMIYDIAMSDVNEREKDLPEPIADARLDICTAYRSVQLFFRYNR